jgi:hypothetical protein
MININAYGGNWQHILLKMTGSFGCVVTSKQWGVPFHPVVVICLGKNLLFKSVLGHCVLPKGSLKRTSKEISNSVNF